MTGHPTYWRPPAARHPSSAILANVDQLRSPTLWRLHVDCRPSTHWRPFLDSHPPTYWRRLVDHRPSDHKRPPVDRRPPSSQTSFYSISPSWEKRPLTIGVSVFLSFAALLLTGALTMLATQAYLLVPSCRMLIGALLPFGNLLLNVDRGPYYLFSALLMISALSNIGTLLSITALLPIGDLR